MDTTDLQDALDLIALQEISLDAQYAAMQKQATNQYNTNKKRLSTQKATLNVQLTKLSIPTE